MTFASLFSIFIENENKKQLNQTLSQDWWFKSDYWFKIKVG